MAGKKDLLAVPERLVDHYHTFHGARPLCHSSSRCVLSRSVSMGCQKPSCSKAESWPPSASFSSGSRSQMQSSSGIKSITFGDSTKNPPLIMPPSPFGFSLNESTLLSCKSNAPKRPGGKVADRVASVPCCLWNSTSDVMLMLLTPSP